jgi:acyl-CoA synthetase (AMP-forming)/AMP-acid ligase II
MARPSKTNAAKRTAPMPDAAMPRTIATLAWEKAKNRPSEIAFHEGGTNITYAAITNEAEALAAGLRSLGIQAGETISFQLPNWREAIAVNLAAAMLGVRVNPITPIYRGAELRFILQDAQATFLFIPQIFRSIDYARMIDDLRPELPKLRHVIKVRAEDAGEASYDWLLREGRKHLPFKRLTVDPSAAKLLLYTSGTTGRSKGVLHTHDSIDRGTMSAVDYWDFAKDDVMLMASPVTHITGYAFGLELPFQSNARVVLMDRWDAPRAVRLIQDHQVTASIGATPFLKELIDEAERSGSNLPSLRMFACGGATVPPALILRTARVTAQCNAFRVYGATEIPLVTKGFCKPAERNLAAETDGRVIGYEVRITGADGNQLARGRVGEVRVRGPAMLAGYTDPAETAKAIDEDGFFKTGDLAMLTDDDAIIVTGRLKDIIIRGGENISPVEIEAALEKHPAIQEAAVVAMPHPRLGEGVATFIRTVAGAEMPSLMEITEFLDQAGLARQKFPERLEYIDDFPRTASGKIRKDQLRAAIGRPLILTLGS